mgnify:CR=1 FL=1
MLFFIGQCFAGWVLTQVWTGGFTIGIATGNGKNDGIKRLYGLYISANTIKEWTWSGAVWNNTSNISLPFYAERPLLVTTGRNDGVNRIYTGEFSGTGNTAEYTWNGVSWNQVNMGATGQQLINLLGRSLDAYRLHSCCRGTI